MDTINWLIVGGLMALNFAISWFNAWSVGRVWNDSKEMGGFAHFITWCGAIMSACGFTWVYLLVLAIIAGATGQLPPDAVSAMISLGYLILIGPIIGSGLGITVQSWRHFWREKNFVNGGVGAWNTYAQIHNTVNALSAVPDALEDVLGFFSKSKRRSSSSSSSDGKGALGLIVIALVVLAIVGGVLTTRAIISATARKQTDEILDDARSRYAA